MSACDICDELAAIKATLADHGDKLTILLTGVGILVAALPSFTVDGVHFDETTDSMARGAALTGVSDSGQFIFSCWAKVASTGSGFVVLFQNQSSTVQISVSNEIYHVAADATYTNALEGAGATGVVDDTWHHILIVGKASTNELSVYLDGTLDDAGAVTVIGTPSTFNFTDTDWNIGAGNAMDLAELYFAPGQWLDFSVASNIEKFRSALGKPVDLGTDGSTPTGSAPAVYLHIDDGEAAANFATNAGTGGDFSITGTLTTASTSPSD